MVESKRRHRTVTLSLNYPAEVYGWHATCPNWAAPTGGWRLTRRHTTRNAEIAGLLEEIADLLELEEENRFRVAAYREAARRIGSLTEPIEDFAREGRLEEIPGVGPSIAGKVDEYLRTGRSRYLEGLRRRVAPGLTELLKVPGIGPARARLIGEQLGVASLADLATAAAEHRICHLPGMREKTEERIRRELARLEQRTRRLLLSVALPAAEEVVELLKGHPDVKRLDPAGSIRRLRETIGDIDILVASNRPERVTEAFAHLPIVKEVLAVGPTKASILTRDNLQIDLRVIKPTEYGAALQYFTGSKAHNIALRELAIRKGYKVSEYGIFDARTGRRLGGEQEEEIYRLLGLAMMPPELRENRGEIEAAVRGELPKLVTLDEIRGDLQTHTRASDGTGTLEKMAEAARAQGYEYLAVTDHSRGLGIAHGMTMVELRAQRREIDRLNRQLAPFRILAGVEVNIRGDGSLDFSDEELAEFDFVAASIHGGFNQHRTVLTGRIVRALRNPYVDLVCHPTGRRLGRREPYDVDLEQVIRAAAQTGKALEINAQPERLDLDDVWARRAKEAGVMLAIDSDAHAPGQLALMRYGVAVARRGWLERPDVLNALPLGQLLARLQRQRRAA